MGGKTAFDPIKDNNQVPEITKVMAPTKKNS